MAAKALNIPHISTGDIFRKNSARAAELRNKEQKLTADEIKFLRRQNHIDKTISEGRLVDDKVVSEIVYDRLAEADCENGFILDGYPRTVVQAQEFDKFLKNQGKGVTVQAVFLDAERNILQERLQMRIDEARAQGKEPRSDDNPETFNKRLIEFSANTMDVVKYYENQRRSVRYDIGEISKESAAPSESIALSIIGRIQGLAEAGVTYEQFWDGVMDAGTHLGGDAWIDHHINKTLTGEHRLTILDLGSGHGLETGYLLSEGHEVISADYSQRMLDAMHKNVPGSNGIKFDIEKDDWSQFKENQFDAIVASFSLHYFDEKTTARIINEIKRVLKPGGKLYVRVNSVNDKVHGAGDGELVEENFYIDRTRNIPKRYFDADSVQRFFAPLGNLSFQEVQSVYNNQPKAAFEIVVVNDKDDISQKPISGAVRAFLDDLKNSISAALEKMEEEQKPAQKDVTGTSKLSGFMRFLAGFRSIFIGSSYHIDGIINEISSLKTEYKTQAEAVIIRAVDLLRRELKLKDNRYYELADWVNNLKSNTSTGEVKVSEEEYYGKINELNLALRLFNMKYYSQSGTIYIDPALRNKGKGILNIIEIDKEKIFADFIKAGRITEEYDKGFHTFGYIINTPLTFDEMNTIINRIRQAEENIGKKSHYAEIVAYHEKARELLEAARKYAGSAAGVNYDLSDSSLSLDFIFPYSYGIDITKKLIGSNKKVRGVVFTDANKISLQFNDNAVARDLQEVIDMFNQTQITDFAKVAWMDLSGNAPSETGRREMEAKLARGAQFINELQSLKEQYIKINKEIKSYMEAVHGVVYKFNEKVNLGNRFMRTVNDAFEQGYIFSDTDMQTVQALIIEISDLLAETADFLDKAGFVASKESEYREYYEYYSNYLNLLEYVDKLKTNRNNLYSELEAALKILNIKSFKVYGDIIAVTFADSDKNAQKIWEEIIAKEKIDIVNITPYIDQTIYAINIYDLTPDKMNAVIKSFVSAASDTSQEDTKPSPIHFSETNEWGDVVYMTGNIMRKSRDLFKNDPDRATEQTKIDAGYIQTIGNENDNIAIDFSFSKVTKPLIGLLFKVALKMNVLRKIKAQFDGYHMNKSTDEDRAVLHTALRNVYYDYNELETEGPAKGLPKIKAYKPVYDRGSDGTERNNVMPEIIEALNQMRIIDLRLQKTQLVKEALSKGMSLEDAKKSVLEVESNGRKIVVDVEPLLGADGSPIETIVSIGIGGSYLGPRLVAESMGGFAKSYGLNVRFIQSVEPSDAETQLKGLKPESTMFIIQSKSWTTAETVMNRDLVLPFMIKGLKDKIPQDVQSKLIIQAASDPSLSYDTLAVKYIISHNCMAVTSKKSMAMDFGIDENNILSFGDYIGGRFSVWGPVGLPAMMSFGFDGFFEMLQGAHDVDAYVENHLGTDPDKPDYFENNAVLKMALIDILNVNGLNFKVNYTLPYASFLDQLAAYLQQLRMESLGKHVMADGRKVSDAARKIPWYYRFLDRLFGHKGRYLSEPDTNTEPVSLGSQAPGHQHSYGLHTVTSVSQQAGQMDFIGVLGTMTKDATEETSKMHTYAFVQLLSQVLVASEGWTKEQLDEKIESTKANKRKEMEKLGKSEAEINEEMGRIESIRDMYDFEGDRPVTVKMLSRLSPRTVGQLLAFEEHRVAFKGYIWNINAYDQPGVQAAKIAADFLFKWALGLGQTVVDTTSSVAGWVAKIADKYSQSKQKDDSEDSGAAIMQQNYPKVFAWLASGNSVLVTALKLAVIEFIPSIFSSDFVKMHLRKSNQGRAAFLHDFTWTIPILISSFFIITATPLGIPAVLMYAGAGILGTFFTNIAVHVAVDFKYIRKISQNIENVIPSVANEEQIKNANHLEVFVINERPENAEKYGFKNTGFTADGHIIWMSKKTGKVVLFSENADFNTIAASYESIVPVVLNRKGENFEISPIAIDDDKVMIMEGKSIKYLDNGITTVKQSYYDEILELCGGDPILAGEMIRNAIEAEKFAFAQDFVMDLSAFTLTDSIDKVVAAANKAGNNQIAIAYSAFKQSNDDAITRETVRKMSENGTRIFAVVLNVGEQYQNKQELEQKLIKQGFAGYIVKNKDMVGENGIGDVVGFKDFYSTADGREVKEIKDFKNSEDLSREIEKAGADSVKIVRMTDYFKHIVGLRDITDKIDSVGVFGRFGKFTFYDGAEMTVDHAVNTALGYKMWAIPSGFKAGDFDEITEMLKLGATPENIAKLQSKLTVELDNSDFKVASLMGVLNRIEAKTKDKSQTQRLEIRFAFLKTIAQRAKVKADIYSKTQNGLKDKNLERDMIQNALSGRDVNRVFINDFVNEIFRKDMNTTDVEKLAEKKALELVGNKAEAATMYQLLLLYAAKELDMKIDDSQNQPINARLVSEFLKAA
ncbi:MAG: nucleoside monophosphate kinase [Endomicrobia bacterium]|nr:nucleoside monophosphate kinase [Endomicrobiia bacterium]